MNSSPPIDPRCFRSRPQILLVPALVLSLAGGLAARGADSIEAAGDFIHYALPATAAGLSLGYRDWGGALQFGASAGLTIGITDGLKSSIDATRPNGGSESFPSGHASISFCSAEFMRKRYGWRSGLPAYAAASFVAYSRVEAGEHYPRDVIAGAGIGILSSYIFTRPYKGWRVQAEADGRYYGLRFTRTF